MRRFLAVVAGICLSSAAAAQDSVHFPPTDKVVILAMRDVPATQLSKGFLGRTIVGATGSFTFGEFDDGAGAAIHHHTREQVNVGIEGVMEMALGTHTEPVPAGAAVISPADIMHSIRNRSGGKLISLEFHTIRRPDLTPARTRPSVPYPISAEPVAVPDDSKLVAQLASPGMPAGIATTIQGKTCTLAWRRLAPATAATDLAPAKSSAELFVYVVSGEADITAPGLSQRVGAGTVVIIPAAQEHVMIKAAGSEDVSLVEFRPSLR
jgi:mannose-6-phosphate isomerase-like protein (cupin superfamily)